MFGSCTSGSRSGLMKDNQAYVQWEIRNLAIQLKMMVHRMTQNPAAHVQMCKEWVEDVKRVLGA